jgi:hypothetical protein
MTNAKVKMEEELQTEHQRQLTNQDNRANPRAQRAILNLTPIYFGTT